MAFPIAFMTQRVVPSGNHGYIHNLGRSPPTYHHEQHCDCSGVIQVPGQNNFTEPEVGQSHWLYCKKGPAEAVLPSPAEEVLPATGPAEIVILCHHWVCPVFIYNCFVWLSYQNRHQKTTTDSQDCWEDYRCPSIQPPRSLYLQSESLWTPLTLSLWTVAVWPALQITEHQNTQTQEQLLHPGHIPPEQHITHPSTVHL